MGCLFRMEDENVKDKMEMYATYLRFKLSKMEAIILQLPFLNEEKGREHSGAKYDSSENSDNS